MVHLIQLFFWSEFCSHCDQNLSHILEEFGTHLLFLKNIKIADVISFLIFWSEKQMNTEFFLDCMENSDQISVEECIQHSFSQV